MLVIVEKAHSYAGKWRNIGEEYDCKPKDAKILKVIGKVSFAENQPTIETPPADAPPADAPPADAPPADAPPAKVEEPDTTDTNSEKGKEETEEKPVVAKAKTTKKAAKNYKTRVMTAK